MKVFADFFRQFFVIAGAVMGAGFLSGGELTVFFGGKNVFCLLLAGAAFFIGFSYVRVEKNALSAIAFSVADFVFASAMLAGLDGIASLAGVPDSFPVASLSALAVFHFFLSGDIKKTEKANCVLIPLAVITVFFAAVTAQSPVPAKAYAGTGAKGVINALLYACMNIFVALPSVNMAKVGKKTGATIAAAAAFSAVFAAFAFLILRVAPNTAFPLLDVSRGTVFYPFTVGAIFVGAFTSLICCMYPLKKTVCERVKNKKARIAGCFLLYAGAFFFSRAGFTRIIKYLYPVVGGLGLLTIVKSFIGIKKRGKGDTKIKRSALCREEKNPKSKNSPKKNTAII